jgi:hypothetical protein
MILKLINYYQHYIFVLVIFKYALSVDIFREGAFS